MRSVVVVWLLAGEALAEPTSAVTRLETEARVDAKLGYCEAAMNAVRELERVAPGHDRAALLAEPELAACTAKLAAARPVPAIQHPILARSVETAPAITARVAHAPACGVGFYAEPSFQIGAMQRSDRAYQEGRVALGAKLARCADRVDVRVGAVVVLNNITEGGFQAGFEVAAERVWSFGTLGGRVSATAGGDTTILAIGPRVRLGEVLALGLDAVYSRSGPLAPGPDDPPGLRTVTGGAPAFGFLVGATGSGRLGYVVTGLTALVGALAFIGFSDDSS